MNEQKESEITELQVSQVEASLIELDIRQVLEEMGIESERYTDEIMALLADK